MHVDPLLFRAEGKWKNIKHFFRSWWEVIKNGYPARKLIVIGVTGTDGKTTTCHLIYEILKAAGLKVALVSTVAAYIGDEEIDTGFHVTTPDAKFLQPFIKRVVDAGMTHLILEATSHGLDQHRVVGCNFKIGVSTNLTRDHLDYHQDLTGYVRAKQKLFKMCEASVINREDAHWRDFAGLSKKDNFYGIKTDFKGKINIPGEYNRYNVLAAVSVARELGVRENVIEKAVKRFELPVGRMERITRKEPFEVFVDFAHTPNALECALTAARQWAEKRLIVVFGCAGLRDKGKRPIMGEIASRLADRVIVTAEDPRTEDLSKISKEIVSGARKKNWEIINDRSKAILKAIKMAKRGDVIMITGKGHEKSMCFGKEERPWSDQDVARKALLMARTSDQGVF